MGWPLLKGSVAPPVNLSKGPWLQNWTPICIAQRCAFGRMTGCFFGQKRLAKWKSWYFHHETKKEKNIYFFTTYPAALWAVLVKKTSLRIEKTNIRTLNFKILIWWVLGGGNCKCHIPDYRKTNRPQFWLKINTLFYKFYR